MAVTDYEFRSKRFGWGVIAAYRLGDKTYYVTSADPYNKSFLSGMTFRECCYECRYANVERFSDATLCDFWGVEKECPELYDRRGVSGVIVNSSKGEILLKRARSIVHLNACDIEAIRRHNWNLNRPSVRSEVREIIYKGIRQRESIKYIESRLCSKVTTADKLKALIPASAKFALKRFLRGVK